MAESRPNQSSDKGAKGKEEKETMLDREKHHTAEHNKETHGLSDDIDADTPISRVKGPNVFERAKEEFEAIVEAIHPRKDKGQKDHGSPPKDDRSNSVAMGLKHEKQSSHADGKKDKVEVKQEKHKEKSPRHDHKESHGKCDDIDVNIPISEFKGPSIFDRAKDEIEALVQTIHPKKESDPQFSSPKKDGFRASLGKKIEKMCSPKSKTRNKD